MKPAPSLKAPATAGAVMMRGEKLNELIAALRARTRLDATATGSKSRPAALPAALDKNKLYFVAPAFWRRLNQATQARIPTETAAMGPQGFQPGQGAAKPLKAGISARPGSLPAAAALVRRITPRQFATAGPLGWTAPPPEGRVAAFRLETESKAATALICAEVRAEDEEYVILSEYAQSFENGSYVDSINYGGEVETFYAGDPPPVCPLPEYTTTQDFEFDYGGFISSTLTEETVTFETLRSAARGALTGAPLVAGEAHYEWPEAMWREVSGDEDVVISSGLAHLGTSSFGPSPMASAYAARWRIVNKGQAVIKVDWETRRALDDELLNSGSETIARGGASEWSAWPTLSTLPDNLFYIDFVRARMGPFMNAS